MMLMGRMVILKYQIKSNIISLKVLLKMLTITFFLFPKLITI